MLKLLHFADRGRSHLNIPTMYQKHFLGEIIFLGQKAMAKMDAPQLQLQSISTASSFIGTYLQITNYQQQNIFLLTMPLESFSEYQQVIDLCANAFPSRKNLSKEEFEASIMRKLLPSKDIGVIDVLYNNCDGRCRIVGFNIAIIVFPKNADMPTLHYIRLAACENAVQTGFSELMSQISFQRVISLKKFSPGEVLTCYTAVSAKSYLQVAKLPHVFPKHDCIRSQDLEYFLELFFSESDIIFSPGLVQCPSRLYYHESERDKDFFKESDVNCKAYNTRYDKPGYATLVAFYASRDNLQKLAGKIKTQLAGRETFFSVAEKAHEMNVSAIKFRNKL